MVRYKSRYLLFEIYYPSNPTSPPYTTFHSASPDNANPRNVASAVRESIALHFGDLGAGRCSALSVKYFSKETSRGIIRCAREQFRTVWAALTFLNEFQGRQAVFRVVRVSGTIKKAELEAIRRNKLELKSAADSLIVEDDGEEIDED